jgi:hypothetical protein
MWEFLPGAIVSTDGGRTSRGVADRSGGSLRVVTTKFKPGYLRKNGVPYSSNGVLTENFDLVNEPNGDSYIILSSTFEDPTYLAQPYLTSVHFKKQADATGWKPTACEAK